MTNKIAFVFPGTGSQYTGMFKIFYDRFLTVKETFEEAEDLLKFNLTKTCFEVGFPEEHSIAQAQVAIFVCSIASFRVYMQEVGVKPSYMAGHSLGEFSALTCAGAMRYQDALKVVWLRGQLMEEAVPEEGGLIAAVKYLSADRVREQCILFGRSGQVTDIACYNAPDQVVVAGHREAMQKLLASLEDLGAQVVQLSAKVPFHTSIMKPAAVKLYDELLRYDISDLKCPVISNVTAVPHVQGAAHMIENLALQLTQSVRWEETIRFMQQEGVSSVVEFGPKTILKKLNRKIARNIRAYAWDDPDDFTQILNMKQLIPAFMDKCLTIAVSTENYNDNRDEYRQGVIEPYKQIQRIHQESENGGMPTRMQIREATELLGQILINKKVERNERTALLRELFEETQTEPFPPDSLQDQMMSASKKEKAI